MSWLTTQLLPALRLALVTSTSHPGWQHFQQHRLIQVTSLCQSCRATAAVEFDPGSVPSIAPQVLGFWCAVPGQAKVRADCPGVSGHAELVACLDLTPPGS